MADLHTTLVAKVTEHLQLAELAGRSWPSIIGIVEGDPPFVAPDQISEHIAMNDPQHVIRACRADLERLERHVEGLMGDCELCAEWADDEDRDGNRYSYPNPVRWPCPEVRAIAAVYGVEVDEVSRTVLGETVG